MSGLAEAWAEFEDSAKAWDQSLRDGFVNFVEGEKVVDQIASEEAQDKARKANWAAALEKWIAVDRTICTLPYAVYANGFGPGLWAMFYVMWRQGEAVTGIAESQIPAHWLARIKANNSTPITEEEWKTWRAMFGCPVPPATTTNGTAGGGTPAPGAGGGGTPGPGAGAWLATVAPQSTAGKLALVGVGAGIVFGVLYFVGRRGNRRRG